MSTAPSRPAAPVEPGEPVRLPRLGPRGYLRWGWRQLTSMRTALFLLLLLAVAAVPGSVFPQRSIDPARTADWIAAHPQAGPILDRVGAFEVYATPWFAAVYLLLLLSLVGCIVPRTLAHLRQLRAAPPRAPRTLARLEAHAEGEADGSVAEVRERAAAALRARRYRVVSHDDETVSAESGYLKESGNLLFHVSLVGLIISMAVGYLWGWRADVVVPAGSSFVSTVTRFDTWSPGPLVDESSLTPFEVRVEEMTARFDEGQTSVRTVGQPRAFSARVSVTDEPGDAPRPDRVAVNHPLEMDGATVFLLGNGYAPVVTVKDAGGRVLYRGVTPFLAQDGNYRSTGAIKVGAAQPQLGFVGLFLPTAVVDPTQGPISVFPDTKNPALALSLYEGDLYPQGRPQSVFSLDTASLQKVLTADGSDQVRLWLQPGEGARLPGDRGTITFDGIERFAGFSVRHRPGERLVLLFAVLSLGGLIASLVLRRRRVFVRVTPAGAGTAHVAVGGMSRDDDEGVADVVAEVLRTIQRPVGESADPTKDER